MSGDLKLDEATYVVTKTCSYRSLATRHILCERNYIEVGHIKVSNLIRLLKTSVPMDTCKMFVSSVCPCLSGVNPVVQASGCKEHAGS